MPDAPLFHPCPADPACPRCGVPVPHPRGPGAFDWSFADAAYCISLRDRADRAASAAAQFHRLGLCRRVTFHRPARGPAGAPKSGIREAHRAVALDALAKGLRTILILEDDARFSQRVTPATVRRVAETLAGLPPDWTIFFLGHWPLPLRAPFVRRDVLRTSSGCAHAYVASPRLLAWLRDHPDGTAPIVSRISHGVDAAYAALPGCYAYFPMLATQSASPSDHLHVRSNLRELLLSRLMRPGELAAAALAPLGHLLDRARGPTSGRGGGHRS